VLGTCEKKTSRKELISVGAGEREGGENVVRNPSPAGKRSHLKKFSKKGEGKGRGGGPRKK